MAKFPPYVLSPDGTERQNMTFTLFSRGFRRLESRKSAHLCLWIFSEEDSAVKIHQIDSRRRRNFLYSPSRRVFDLLWPPFNVPTGALAASPKVILTGSYISSCAEKFDTSGPEARTPWREEKQNRNACALNCHISGETSQIKGSVEPRTPELQRKDAKPGCECGWYVCMCVCVPLVWIVLVIWKQKQQPAALELTHQVGGSSIFDVLSPSWSSLDRVSWPWVLASRQYFSVIFFTPHINSPTGWRSRKKKASITLIFNKL